MVYVCSCLLVGWQVEAVCMLLKPVAFAGNLKRGFLIPRPFTVQFAVNVDRHFLAELLAQHRDAVKD